MDTKKAQIKQLNEQVRESGDRIRQLQKGTSFFTNMMLEIILSNLSCSTKNIVQSCKA